MQKRISIITGVGGHLGSGHLQRMANLAEFIIGETAYDVSIVMKGGVDLLPPALRPRCVDSIPSASSLLIRDMRDSTLEEMSALRRVAPTIAVDDCGPGRNLATHPIDLLPNPLDTVPRSDLFLFGHAFTASIRAIDIKTINKTIDVALYCGFRPVPETVQSLLSLVPEELTCALLAGDDSRIIESKRSVPLPCSFAEALLASRVLVSHFGITLYEGHISGCRLVSVNPTAYHASLVDKVDPVLNPVNLGILPVTNPSHAASIILKTARNPLVKSIETAIILEQITRKLRNFLTEAAKIISA